MKTLAMVTVMFLPGAWVAALFAVPLFEWNAEADKKVLSGRFWVYWCVNFHVMIPFLDCSETPVNG